MSTETRQGSATAEQQPGKPVATLIFELLPVLVEKKGNPNLRRLKKLLGRCTPSSNTCWQDMVKALPESGAKGVLNLSETSQPVVRRDREVFDPKFSDYKQVMKVREIRGYLSEEPGIHAALSVPPTFCEDDGARASRRVR